MVTFEYDVPLVGKLDEYTANHQPAILCFEKQAVEEGMCTGPYGILTINLGDDYVDLCNQDVDGDWFYQYLDVNNWPDIEDALADCDWCEPAGIIMPSGYVKYPLYKFRKEAFNA